MDEYEEGVEPSNAELGRMFESCTEDARRHGCSCTMESSHSASIDPPEPIVSRDCPLHGNAPDPDAAYEAQRDDAAFHSTWLDDEPY